MRRKSLLVRIAANPRLVLVCAVVVLGFLQVAVGGALGDAPVTPTDGNGGSTVGP